MGQKSNLITLKKSKPNLNLINYETKTFLYSLQYLNYFEILLSKKNIWVIKKTFLMSSSNSYLTLDLFYRSVKTTFYKKKGLILSKKQRLVQKNKTFANLFSKNFPLNKVNSIICNVTNLNKEINTLLLAILYNKTKKFITNIFVRRFNLYIDFVKLTTLLIQNKIGIDKFIYVLALIFKSLSKRVHTRFLFFLKALFKIIISISGSKENNLANSILGFKFIINGKLQGKTRASSSCIQEGSVPTQSFSKSIEFSRSHIYTLYGVFGIRMWLYKK
jgi:hypothetical protein